MRGGDAHQGADRLGRVRQRGPARNAAPVVPDDHAGGEAKTLDHAGHVEGGGLRVVSAWSLVTCPVAAQVHGGRAEAGGVQRGYLVPPCPPELTESVQQQHQRSARTELLPERNVESDPVGCDIAMTPRPFEQDVAYAGPGHVGGCRIRAGLPAADAQVMALVWRDDLSLDLRRVRRSERALRRLLTSAVARLAWAMVRSGGLTLLTNRYPIPARMPAINSSATPTIKNASHAARPALQRGPRRQRSRARSSR